MKTTSIPAVRSLLSSSITIKAQFFATLAVLLSLAACQPGGEDEALLKLQAEQDSLTEVKANTSARLAELQNLIAALDTTTEKRIPSITTMKTELGMFEHFFEVQGTVETDQNALIYPEAQARITKIHVKEGDKVGAGTVLMSLDSRVIRNSIEELETQLELAETVYQKQKKLWDQEIGSEIQFLEAETNRNSLVKRLETTRSQLDMYSVKAPFAGVVDEITPKAGEMASPMAPVARLINLDEVYIKADVSESYLSKIELGDTVEIHFPSLGKTVNTRISRMGNYINPNNRTFKITLNIPNVGGNLKPNLLGEVVIRDFEQDSTVVIPNSVIMQTMDGNDFVYLVEKRDGMVFARQRMIETGMTYGTGTHVTSGLSGNETLIVKGARTVRNGEEVRIQGTAETALAANKSMKEEASDVSATTEAVE